MKRRSSCVAVLTIFAIYGCGSNPPSSETAQTPSKAAEPSQEGSAGLIELSDEAVRTAGIKTNSVQIEAIQEQLVVPGTVSTPANAKAVVTPPVAGKVVRLYAGVGDSVRRGQALAEIQSGDLAQATSAIAQAESQAAQAAAAIRQEQASLDIARGRLRTAQEALERQKRLAKTGAFSQPSLTAARNELSEAQTEQASARSSLAGAQSRLDRAERLAKEGLVAGADLEQARLDVREAKIRSDRAEERLRLARETYERESEIGSQGLLNAREIQTAEAEARSAKLELDRARVDLLGASAAKESADRGVLNARRTAAATRGGNVGGGSTITLTAPISGVITERQASLGQAVERSTDLFDVVDTSTVWVTANVPEKDIATVVRGGSVTVTVNALPDRLFVGTVRIVGAQLDPKSRTLPVQCLVANPGGLLRGEMFAKVSIGTGKAVRGIAVPRSALAMSGEETYVFVAKGGKYEHRKVVTGANDGQHVAVTSGLQAAEQIVVDGIFVLESERRKSELKGDED